MPLRHLLVTAAAAGTAGALALTAPVVARSVFDARNAHKVDGLHAAQLTKIQGYADNATFDNFDTCTFTSVLTRTFRAPHSGVIAVTGQVVATKDFGSVDDALLVTRVVVDGKRSGTDATVALTVGGSQDGSVVALGARKVKAGNHTVEIQAEECSSGAAFIQTQSMVVTFSAFGSALTSPPRAKPGQSLDR